MLVLLLIGIVGLLLLFVLADLLGSSLDIHTVGADTLTLFTLAGSLLLTLLATFLLRLFLGTRTLVERRKVYFTYDIQLRGRLHEVTRCLC